MHTSFQSNMFGVPLNTRVICRWSVFNWLRPKVMPRPRQPRTIGSDTPNNSLRCAAVSLVRARPMCTVCWPFLINIFQLKPHRTTPDMPSTLHPAQWCGYTWGCVSEFSSGGAAAGVVCVHITCRLHNANRTRPGLSILVSWICTYGIGLAEFF